MYIDKVMKGGESLRIVITNRAKERLADKFARRTETGWPCTAGRFYYWRNLKEFLHDDWVIDQILFEASNLLKEKESGTHSVTFSHRFLLGWESTDSRGKYRTEHLEKFRPNRKSTALRVRPELSFIHAPTTKEVTVVFEFRPFVGRARHTFIIHSLYPGVDVGEISGDVTEREGRIFFDWEHPGAALSE